jgi:hypothetical protein
MKSKSLLALSAIMILIAVIAIGCSNSGRTTAPASNTESLNLPGSSDVNRFDTTPTTPTIQESMGGLYIVGMYNIDRSNCQTIKYGKDMIAELQFLHESSIPLRNGMIVSILGRLSTLPGAHCQLSTVIIVDDIRVISQSDIEVPNTPGND